MCFVGCYNSYGLAAYNNKNGVEHWRRRDLKAVQSVHPLSFDDLLFCGHEGAGHLLSTTTGSTVEKFRGVKVMYSDAMSKNTIVSGRTLDLHSPFGRRIKKIARATFAELSCCFSPSEVLSLKRVGMFAVSIQIQEKKYGLIPLLEVLISYDFASASH